MIKPGQRISIAHHEAFPRGAFVTGVQQATEYGSGPQKRPVKDPETGAFIFVFTCLDGDESLRRREFTVKVAAPFQPELPPEVAPGLGIRAVEFSGLTVTPYIEESRGREGTRARLAYSYRATGVHAPGKAPAAPVPARSVPAGPNEGKAA